MARRRSLFEQLQLIELQGARSGGIDDEDNARNRSEFLGLGVALTVRLVEVGQRRANLAPAGQIVQNVPLAIAAVQLDSEGLARAGATEPEMEVTVRAPVLQFRSDFKVHSYSARPRCLPEFKM